MDNCAGGFMRPILKKALILGGAIASFSTFAATDKPNI